MKKDLNEVIENIFIIKNSIGKAQRNYDKIYKFLLLLGIINLVYHGMAMILAIGLEPPIGLRYQHINQFLYAITLVAFFIYYIKIYIEEKISSNKYYLSFLNIFAGITFLLPFLMFIIRMLLGSMNIPYEEISASLIQLQELEMLANVFLFCSIVVLCGHILRKKSMTVISAVFLFIYLVILFIYKDVEYAISFSVAPTFISLLSMYHFLLISIGYIILAMIIKYKNSESDTNGNN